MPEQILYAYAILKDGATGDVESIDPVPEGESPHGVGAPPWKMIVSRVPGNEYSQESIDRHADDLEWLGAIGVAHQRVNDAFAQDGDAIPLRAFTLFSDESAVRRWLENQKHEISGVYDRIAGKLEWTVKLDFGGTAWMSNPDLESLESEIASAPEGKAYLLQKKLERELERTRSDMEDEFVRDLASWIERESGARTIVETRSSRGGADPQIDLLYDRNEADTLESLLEAKCSELEEKEITATVTGPWPPYSFAGRLG